MVEEKMTTVLVSTDKFIATCTFPVKNKVIEQISRHVTETHESEDAVIEIMPVEHTVMKEKIEESLPFYFFTILTHPASAVYTKNKQAELQNLIDKSSDKVRHQLHDLQQKIKDIRELEPKANRVLINLLDKSGKEIVHSYVTSVHDIVRVLDAFISKLNLQVEPKKLPAFLVQHELPAAPKPRHKERMKGEKEGGMRRFRSGVTIKAA